jgi:hypothetical protein
VSSPLTVVATSADAALAGIPDGQGRTAPGPTIALGHAPADAPDVRWLDRPWRPDDPVAGRLMAPSGERLWRVAPWPAAEALFELAPPASDAVLVVGAGERSRSLVKRARERALAVDHVEILHVDTLTAAACVILADAPGGALPARAFSVLAAGRLLMVPQIRTTFGLEDGLDHLQFIDPDEALSLVESYRADPAAFDRVIAWGRRKAQPQRASVVYGRLADDLCREERE